MVVQHNLQAINANRMLGITQGTLSSSTEKLSSGYKINRAADDAAGLSISEKMRKQIRGLTQASTNAEDGISAVQTAEGALQEVQDMLQRMNELSVQASNGTLSESDRQDIQNEVDNLVTEVDRVSETTKFNETYLLKGDNTVDKKTTYEYNDVKFASDTVLYDSTGTEVKKGTVLSKNSDYFTDRTAAIVAGEKLDGANAADLKLLTAKQVTFDKAVYTADKDGNVTYVKAGTKVDVGTVVYADAIKASSKDKAQGYEIKEADFENQADAYGNGLAKQITDSANNQVDLKVKVAVATSSISLYTAGAVAGTVNTYAAGENIEVLDNAGTNKLNTYAKAVEYTGANKIDVANYKDYGNAVQLMDKDGNEIAENGLYSYFDKYGKYKGGLYTYADEKNPSIKNLKELSAADVDGYTNKTQKETGALTLTLHVGADVTKNNQISVEIDAMSASSLGVEGLKVTGKDDTNALNSIETIKAALQQVSEQRSALGAVQNRLEHTIKNLDNVVENTTSAESQIRDTDMATEMVKYSNSNILAQAGQSMLAQANQSNQGVLSLLG